MALHRVAPAMRAVSRRFFFTPTFIASPEKFSYHIWRLIIFGYPSFYPDALIIEHPFFLMKEKRRLSQLSAGYASSWSKFELQQEIQHELPPKITQFWKQCITLRGINISHLGKRKIIFKMQFLGDMLVPWRVPTLTICHFLLVSRSWKHGWYFT